VEGLCPAEGLDPVNNDTRYLRNWKVSQPLLIPKGIDFIDSLMKSYPQVWKKQ
jgi:hypothetical protein